MRAALRIFEDAFGPEAAALHEEVGWVGHGLGSVRDRDVQIERLRQVCTSRGNQADPAAFQEIVRAVEERRTIARRLLLALLDSRRATDLWERLAAFVASEPRGTRAAEPATSALPPLIEARQRQLEKAGLGLAEDSPPERYHRLRVRAKRLRYAVEAASGLYGRPAARYEKRLTALQDVLGNHQDAVVAQEHLHELLRDQGEKLSPEAVFLMGELAAHERSIAASLRRRFRRVYRRVVGKARKRLQRRLRARARAAAHDTDYGTVTVLSFSREVPSAAVTRSETA
jgi:CHAD domain-containing protein